MPNIITKCNDCVFATFATKAMDIQTGCALNRIDIYKQQGETVYLTLDEREYYNIPNRLCMAHRVQEWIKDKTTEEQINAVYEEIAIECHVIIIVKPNEHLSVVLNTIRAIQLQTNKPAYLTIILKIAQNTNNNLDRVTIVNYLNKQIGTDFRWRLQNVLSDVNEDQSINMVLDIENSHQYFMIIHSGVILPCDILTQLNDLITKKLLIFWYIRGNTNGDGIVCSNKIAKMYGINHNRSLFDKIDEDFKDNRTLWNKRVFQINNLIPNFPT